jgi:hypothetical protein
LAAWAGREPEPSVRLVGLSTDEELGELDGKMSDVETRGAGRTATRRAAITRTVGPAIDTVRHGKPRTPAIDCHMDTSPQMPQAIQATT